MLTRRFSLRLYLQTHIYLTVRFGVVMECSISTLQDAEKAAIERDALRDAILGRKIYEISDWEALLLDAVSHSSSLNVAAPGLSKVGKWLNTILAIQRQQ